jgi:hypothetical protein
MTTPPPVFNNAFWHYEHDSAELYSALFKRRFVKVLGLDLQANGLQHYRSTPSISSTLNNGSLTPSGFDNGSLTPSPKTPVRRIPCVQSCFACDRYEKVSLKDQFIRKPLWKLIHLKIHEILRKRFTNLVLAYFRFNILISSLNQDQRSVFNVRHRKSII